jgi:hypothetical protein
MAPIIPVLILPSKVFAPLIKSTKLSVIVTTNSVLPVLTGKTAREQVTPRDKVARNSGINLGVGEDVEDEVAVVDQGEVGNHFWQLMGKARLSGSALMSMAVMMLGHFKLMARYWTLDLPVPCSIPALSPLLFPHLVLQLSLRLVLRLFPPVLHCRLFPCQVLVGVP